MRLLAAHDETDGGGVMLGNSVSCRELGFAAGSGRGWDHIGVLLSLVYRRVRCLLGLLVVLVRSDLSKDAELPVLRHEHQVLCRQRLTLVQLAVAFVTAHPAVTSAIIGPRTAGQLAGLLAAADVTLETAILDRIDEIVPPGISLNLADAVYGEAALADPARRRRAVVDPKRP